MYVEDDKFVFIMLLFLFDIRLVCSTIFTVSLQLTGPPGPYNFTWLSGIVRPTLMVTCCGNSWSPFGQEAIPVGVYSPANLLFQRTSVNSACWWSECETTRITGKASLSCQIKLFQRWAGKSCRIMFRLVHHSSSWTSELKCKKRNDIHYNSSQLKTFPLAYGTVGPWRLVILFTGFGKEKFLLANIRMLNSHSQIFLRNGVLCSCDVVPLSMHFHCRDEL
jgi:hypothetical protein